MPGQCQVGARSAPGTNLAPEPRKATADCYHCAQMSKDFAPAELLNPAIWIIRRLHQAGHEAFVAGGAVRDYCMGRPQSDLDIATSARPEEVRALFPRTFAVGEAFGVVIVPHQGRNFEVATFREEADYRDGRHPDTVRYANARADVARRDFTINGMLWEVESATLLDWVGGEADVRARLVRTIGDPLQRFGEDKLRLLRALRFAAQLDFIIEDETLRAMKELAPGIRAVSLERVRQEMDKLLAAPAVARGLELLHTSGLWTVLRGWLAQEAQVLSQKQELQLGGESGTPWLQAWINAADQPLLPRSSPCAFQALLLDAAAWPASQFHPHQERAVGSALQALVRALRGSRPELAQARNMATLLCALRELATFSLADQLRLQRLPEFPWAQALARHHPAFAKAPFALMDENVACHQNRWHPKPLLSGNDMMAMGIPPGPMLGQVMRQQESAQLEGRMESLDQARALVQDALRATGIAS